MFVTAKCTIEGTLSTLVASMTGPYHDIPQNLRSPKFSRLYFDPVLNIPSAFDQPEEASEADTDTWKCGPKFPRTNIKK